MLNGMAKDTTRQVVEQAFAEVAAAQSGPVRLVEEMELSTRSQNCLRNAGIETVEQLVTKTEFDLAVLRGLGRLSLREIVTVLADMGLALRPSWNAWTGQPMSVLPRKRIR